jgi:uncharacterized membrane protein (DUF2068 family)
MTNRDSTFLRLIAVFKLFKALTLIVVGIAAVRLFHTPDAADSLTHLAARIGFSPGARFLDQAIGKVANLPPRDFRDLGVGSFVYAALFLTEGLGLWLRKTWAEWFTAIITASLVPLEIFELYRHPSAGKGVVLLINLAVVVYLVVRIRRNASDRNRQA